MVIGSSGLLKTNEMEVGASATVDGGDGGAERHSGAGANLRLAFNGKFLSAAPTGVHRVAAELISAFDRCLQTTPGLRDRIDAVVLAPRNATRSLDLRCIRTKKVGRLTGQLWEQVELPFRTQGRLLVSLCNLGPVATRNTVTMIHDAQVHITPASYSRAFRIFYRTAQPLMGRRHRRILTVSEYSRRQLDQAGVAVKSKVDVIHNGVDHVIGADAGIDAASELGLRPRKFVLALSNIQPHKNISVLLRAFAQPQLEDFQLVLFGKPDRSAFEAAGHVVPPNVRFVGTVSDDVLVGLMREALCLAFPSTTEGFGLPPLEAMRAGCPALVSPCGALPEVCGDAVDYVTPESPQAWGNAIVELAAHDEKRESRVSQGLTQAGTFTWDRAARQMLAVLDAVTEDKVA